MKHKTKKHKSGITVIAKKTESDVISVSFVIRAGSRFEKEGERGYAHILEHLLLQGTKNIPSMFEINKRIERSGAWLNVFTDVESIRVSASVVRGAFPEIFRLMLDMVFNPLVSANVLMNEKKVILEERRRYFGSPASVLWNKTSLHMFPNHPLSHSPVGEEEDINKATESGVRSYHTRLFTPDRIALVVIGNINIKNIFVLLDELEKEPFVYVKKNIVDRRVVFPKQDKDSRVFSYLAGKQSQISINIPVHIKTFKEYMSFEILATYLGYRHTSLLYQALRHSSGLIYSVGVFNMMFSDAVFLHIQTASSSPGKVIDIILEKLNTLDREMNEPLFNEYKKQILNTYKRKFSNPQEENLFLCKNWIVFNDAYSASDIQIALRGLSYRKFLEGPVKSIKKNRKTIIVLGENNPFK